jgi:wobble nucleotide-excising tRNase
MSNTLKEIAQQLKDTNKKVQLIYAFNGSGKTRLSREFKELVAPKPEDTEEVEQAELPRTKILYYNAFTEDLFYWDNDLENDSKRKLKIQPNSFTDWVLKDQGQDQNIITNFQHYTSKKLTPHFNSEYLKNTNDPNSKVDAFSEVSFTFERGHDEPDGDIKISKGEESCFIWSIFYSLIDQVIEVLNVAEPSERETDQFDQLEYIFIDDPVSSLDENHLIALAVDLAQLIKSSSSNLRFVLSTHNPLFYNVLCSELKSAQGYILNRHEGETFELVKKDGHSNRSFSYHLYIKQLIEQAVEQNEVQRYHFALLRNLYEKASSFLGYREWSDLLPGDRDAYAKRIMHFYSHRTLSHEEVVEPTEPEKQTVKLLVEHLTNEYRFWQQGEQNA